MSKRDHLIQEIIEKAWSDPNFKQDLINNPKKAIKDSFGLDIPDNLALTVHEETDDHFHLVIPKKPCCPPHCGEPFIW